MFAALAYPVFDEACPAQAGTSQDGSVNGESNIRPTEAVAFNMKKYSLIFLLLTSCASIPTEPSWNLPLLSITKIESIDLERGGIGKVMLVVKNTTTSKICLRNHIVDGGNSNILSSDLLDERGRRVLYGDRGVVVEEPDDIFMLEPNQQDEWQLDYYGLYAQEGGVKKGYKFRVILPALKCNSVNEANILPDIILTSDFVLLDDFIVF